MAVAAAARSTGGRSRMDRIQRARLLAAVAEIASEHGVANVAVAHVVARAGVSRRTFYELFSDGDACLLAATDEALARLRNHVLDCYEPRAHWTERIRTGLAATLAFLDAEPDASRLLIASSLGAIPGAQARREQVLGAIVAVVDEGRELTKAGPRLPPLTAEGIVGGALSVVHTRLAQPDPEPTIELLGPLMGMIVLPYLGAAAAQRELARSAPAPAPVPRHESNPLRDLGMRLTYRTVCVLAAIAAHPGASNRTIALEAEVLDQGQMSRLLSRLQGLELIANMGDGAPRGAPNAWSLTERGWQVQATLARQGAGV